MEKKKVAKRFGIFLIISIMILSLTAASMLIPANQKAIDNARAPEHSGVIGENWDLERVDFIHYAKPSQPGNPSKSSSCYKLMGVKWTSFPVAYVINPSNPQGLSEDFIMSSMKSSAETWDTQTSKELFSDFPSLDYSAQYGVQDFKNSIVFGNPGDNTAIGITSVWFSRASKRIVEFDQIYNTYFIWGDATANQTSNGTVMDLQNIATHELGHAIGLSDIYTTSCNSVTMYGYSGEGETSKRTLEAADIAGLVSMYGI